MSGVWVFKNGVVRLVENPGGRQGSDGHGGSSSGSRRKVLVYVPTNEIINSYEMLERKLNELGWERYRSDSTLLQLHKRSSVHLISLPPDFSRFSTVHMYDIVVKSRNDFEVRDA
ncbi:Flowering-promoting factor 1-like protein 3 [Apostasia shenzhenica]|uniref:Flowering-promoting factor 1-like protein 3 n=1 Tax=Apostasia shenzhenica TaxID=1088818 RepID=A0A2I0BCB3_9ASPA|nr:Flowering-promoting factor 1-like protein 3 [Apostasia shenzhenica]